MLTNNLYFMPTKLVDSIDYLSHIIKGITASHIIKIDGDNYIAYGVSSRGLKITSKLLAQFKKEIFANRKYIGIVRNLGE